MEELENREGDKGAHDKAERPAANTEYVDCQLTKRELETLARHYLNRHFAEKLRIAANFDRCEDNCEDTFTWQRFCQLQEALRPIVFDYISDFRQAEVEEVKRETRLRHAMASWESKKHSEPGTEEMSEQSTNKNKESGQ